MPYPPPPWTLRGEARFSLHLVDIRHVRRFVPAELAIVPVLPGKTLGVAYLAAYGAGSALAYHELIIASALTWRRAHLGFWISHIYVDNLDSVAGGREIWGLPKEMAHFVLHGEHVTGDVLVEQADQPLCEFSAGNVRWLWRQPLFVPAISRLGTDLLTFRGTITARMGIGGSRVAIPPTSPFAGLLSQAWLTMSLRAMTFVASVPRRIGSIAGGLGDSSLRSE